MRLKAVSGIMLTLLLIGMLTLAFNIQPVKSELKTWTVDDDGPADFHTIQEAINIANPGDTIYVCNGTYYENVVVNKDNLTLIGENSLTTIIDGLGAGQIIITIRDAENVKFRNFMVRNSSGYAPGIYLFNSSNCDISRNNVENNYHGINLYHSFNNSIWGNNFVDNYFGINLAYSANNTVYHNNLVNNIEQGYTPGNYNNIWDDGYPSGGNYWSDHVCTGNPSDGSQPYIIDENNIDHYPFQDPDGWVIPGDINNDEIVSISDVVIAALAFGSYPGHPRWNPNADIRQDGIINIIDLVIIGVNFGKRLPL